MTWSRPSDGAPMSALIAHESAMHDGERSPTDNQDRALTTYRALLRHLRLRAGLSQAELAGRAGVSPNTIGNSELGVVFAPRRDTHSLVCHALRPFVCEAELHAFDTAYDAIRSAGLRLGGQRRLKEERP